MQPFDNMNLRPGEMLEWTTGSKKAPKQEQTVDVRVDDLATIISQLADLKSMIKSLTFVVVEHSDNLEQFRQDHAALSMKLKSVEGIQMFLRARQDITSESVSRLITEVYGKE